MTATQWTIWAWSVLGVVAILMQAVIRLTPHALEVLDGTLTPLHWACVALWTAFMLYTEAWRGFHKQFSPRVVVRAMGVARQGNPLHVVLAPIVAMGLIHGTRKRLVVSRALLVGIIALIVLVRLLPHPWRAIVDVGVVLGLLAGTWSVLWFAVRAAIGDPPDVPSDFPG